MKVKNFLLPAAVMMAGPAMADNHQDGMEAFSDWPDKQKETIRMMTEQYGEPDGVLDSRVVWSDPQGDWEEIIIYRNEVDHGFPMPHTDYLEQAVYLDVPADKMDELAAFDGSVIVFRTEGRIAARCDKQAANYLALNLAHDIINDEITVEEARTQYADSIKQMQAGTTPDIMKSLTFDPASAGQAAFPDETVIAQGEQGEESETPRQTASRSN